MKIHVTVEDPPKAEPEKPKGFETYHPPFVVQMIGHSIAYTECEPVIRRLLRSSYGAACQGPFSVS
jgi:hypothetical protein